MEDAEEWSDSGSILKVGLTGFGNKMDVWCGKRNSRVRLRFWLSIEKDGTTIHQENQDHRRSEFGT